MARTTYVKRAQQRYVSVLVRNEDGTPKRTPVTNQRTGDQKVTKTGRPIFMTVTVPDKSQPLPNHVCGKCSKEIEVGDPYKHISPKSGPYGGRTLYRCGTCPGWHVWEYSNSLSARVAQIAHEAHEAIQDVEDTDGAHDVLNTAAESIREIAEEKRESASNIVDGFGHDTSQSEELESNADELESWADDVEQAEIPDFPEPEEGDCEACEGEGTVENDEDEKVECQDCEGAGTCTPDEPTEEQVDDWRSEVEDAISVVDDCPV